jgi:hypothetical protein
MQGDQCVGCIHYLGAKTCEAYPEEIPDEIYIEGFDHREPFKDDNGIRWEPVPE